MYGGQTKTDCEDYITHARSNSTLKRGSLRSKGKKLLSIFTEGRLGLKDKFSLGVFGQTASNSSQIMENQERFFSILFLLLIAHLISVYSVDFELCDQEDITSENGNVFLNVSALRSQGRKIECRRLIHLGKGRVKMTINVSEAFLEGENSFEVFDGGFDAPKIHPEGPKREKIYKSTGNTMAVVLKVENSSKIKDNVVLHGAFISVPLQTTCTCGGIQNGFERCWEISGEKKCEVFCKDGFDDLTGSTGNYTCNLVTGKWDIDFEKRGLGCQSTVKPSLVIIEINFTITESLWCNSTAEKISQFFRDYLKANKNVSENGQCFFGENRGNNCTFIECVKKNNTSFVSLTIQDKAVTNPPSVTEKSTFNNLHAAYNATSFQEIKNDLLLYINDTLNKYSLLETSKTSVKIQCPTGMFLFLTTRSIGHPVCSKCPAGSFYKDFKCQKCSNGTSSLEGSVTCSLKEISKDIDLSKDSCSVYCALGKELNFKTGLCQWCPHDTYQNRTDVPNVNCSACPSGKRTRYPGARGIDQCYVPCPKGTFFSIKDEKCISCPEGAYQEEEKHLYVACKKCPQGKVTFKNGGMDPAECVASCTKGHYFDLDSRQCLKCPLGSYQNSTNQLNCTHCPDKTSTLNNGSIQDIDCIKTCSVGTYFDTHNRSCVKCPKGTYMDQSGGHLVMSCKKCPGNRTTLEQRTINATQCLSKCRAGEYFNVQSSSCIHCPLGLYMDDDDHLQKSCKKCENDETTLDKGRVHSKHCLKKCIDGEYFDIRNNSCTQCPLGTYMNESGHVRLSCKKCGANETTYDKGAVDRNQCMDACSAGKYFNSTITSCVSCPRGFYQSKPAQTICHPCPSGQSTKSSGETSMLACVKICGPGEYLNTTTGECHPCPTGTYQSTVNHTLLSCQQCLSKTSSVTGATHPDACTKICDGFPCENGVECVEKADVYCKCPLRVSGKRCEVIEKQEDLHKLQMSVRFMSLNWSSELEDKTNDEYRKVKYRVESSVRKVFMEEESFVGVQVTGLVKGSVIAHFDLYMNDNASIVPAETLQKAVRNGSVGGLPVDPTFLSIRQVSCDRALGMENGLIKNEQIDASSKSEGQESRQGRLNSATGWRANKVSGKIYLQVSFQSNMNITAIATQGDALKSYVTLYSLSYSKDGNVWTKLKDSVNSTLAKNFTGNNDTTNTVKNLLPEPITAVKYIRVIPVSWTNGIGMRIEVYGCISDPFLSVEDIPTSRPTVRAKTSKPDVEAVGKKENKYSWGKYLGITFGLLMVVGCLVSFFMWWRKSKKKQQREKTPLVLTKLQGSKYKVIEKDGDDCDEDAV